MGRTSLCLYTNIFASVAKVLSNSYGLWLTPKSRGNARIVKAQGIEFYPSSRLLPLVRAATLSRCPEWEWADVAATPVVAAPAETLINYS